MSEFLDCGVVVLTVCVLEPLTLFTLFTTVLLPAPDVFVAGGVAGGIDLFAGTGDATGGGAVSVCGVKLSHFFASSS
jgi:hypothetical protein